jgi:hypothetical protein
MLIRLKQAVRDAAHQIDRAITLGVSAMYPIVFNLPAPDPVPDWKKVVGLGWKVVRVTFTESRKAFKEISTQELDEHRTGQTLRVEVQAQSHAYPTNNHQHSERE